MAEDSRYGKILVRVFLQHYIDGAEEVAFNRADIPAACHYLSIAVPKNIGDVVYSYRYRRDLPEEIAEHAPEGKTWIVVGRGDAKYAFVAIPNQDLTPNPHMAAIKVPDATPGIIARYAFSSEQALLAKLRYNRLIDLFTGIVCYSLQNHLRARVPDIGQTETDEIYLGIDRAGRQYVIPVEAKAGSDRLSIVQMNQDLALAKYKFSGLEIRLVGAQFVGNDVALFLFAEDGENSGNVKVIAERRYVLVPPDQITVADLQSYSSQLPDF